MHKKLIALAIAGLSSAAFAQTNVTLYGVADVSLEAASASSNGANPGRGNFARVDSNDSFVGLKGTEDLGDGLKALFQFETGFSADKGVYSGFGHDTFVGLSGGFGTVTGGHLSTATRNLGTRMEMLPGNAGVGTADSLLEHTGRLSNAVQYQSVDFNGFNFAAAYGAGEDKNFDGATFTQNSKTYDLGVNYAIGGWDMGLAYRRFGTGSNAPGATDTIKNLLLGLGYTFDGGHKVTAQWEKRKEDAVSIGHQDFSAYSLQGLYKVSAAGGLIAEYTKLKDTSGNLGEPQDGAKMFTLGYVHNLSKRTLVKVVYSKIKNNGIGADSDFANGPTAFGSGADARALSFGVRHAF